MADGNSLGNHYPIKFQTADSEWEIHTAGCGYLVASKELSASDNKTINNEVPDTDLLKELVAAVLVYCFQFA